MRKILASVIVGGATLVGVGAKAAPPSALAPLLAPPHVQAVEWDGWRGREEWREREWRRREAWEHERRREQWERWHRWHEARERGALYGD